jgi:hypothetical protein
MTTGLIIFIYSIAIYGFSNMMAFGSGPFKIFEKIREWSEYISEHFSTLFKCMMCLPANLGWICSLINWFLIPEVAITPFNIILFGTNLWWVALIGDCCFATGIVWLIHNVESFFESIATGTASNQEEDEEDNDIINLKE